jgi:A nuclease family of the HNH/ENDO VII superfamily with conserved AHH
MTKRFIVGLFTLLFVFTGSAHAQKLGYVADSKILDYNMQLAKITRLPERAAHHIVAGKDPRAAISRAILAREKIDINSAMNGVYLPRNLSSPCAAECVHSVIHTDKYYIEVDARLTAAATRGPLAIRPTLVQISLDLLNGVFPYK